LLLFLLAEEDALDIREEFFLSGFYSYNVLFRHIEKDGIIPRRFARGTFIALKALVLLRKVRDGVVFLELGRIVHYLTAYQNSGNKKKSGGDARRGHANSPGDC